MTAEVSERYPRAATSPADARHFCVRVLGTMLAGRPGADDVVADAEMVVSELVTNAVNAACTFAELVLMAGAGVVRIEVCDDGRGELRSGDPGPDATSGRGLMIVAALSRDWGVLREPAGKRVWAELSLPHAAAS